MFHTILAGCDGGERGRSAAAFATTLARATGARLVLASVYHQPPLPVPASYRETAHEVEHAIGALRDEIAPEATTTVVPALSPAHGLHRAARREHADLIVVGSRRRGPLQHLVDADHALQVVHCSPNAVLIVPDETDVPERLRRVAVGVDGSPESSAALALAADIAKRSAAQLHVTTVVDDQVPAFWTARPGLGPPIDWSELVDDCRVSATETLERAVRELDCPDVAVDVVIGRPVQRLASLAADMDLLVLGSRHWGALARLALGSTSEAVVRRGTGPVLVLPRGAVDADGRSAATAARAGAS